MADFDAVPFDLEQLARAKGLCDWMFSQFEDAAHGTVVEIGAGIGTFSQRVLDNGVDRLVLVEPDPVCARVLRARFGADPRVRLLEEALSGSGRLVEDETVADFVLCQNVLEHIDDDASAVGAMAKVLRPGGQLGVLVPAHPVLGALDRRYGHHRRYTRPRIERVIGDAGLELRDLYSFNLLGARVVACESPAPGGPGRALALPLRVDRAALALARGTVAAAGRPQSRRPGRAAGAPSDLGPIGPRGVTEWETCGTGSTRESRGASPRLSGYGRDSHTAST